MVLTHAINLKAAYQYCEQLAYTHYENFPVASLILPKNIRQAITVIYAFARQADDIADEGDLPQEMRLERLDNFRQSLDDLVHKDALPKEPIFIALQDVFIQHPQLPITLFYDLLHAFKQDVIKNIYFNYHEILDYCRYSANPVGRLLLYLTQNDTEQNLKYSDAICTALQLINFLQDLLSDLLLRQRCYLPKDEMDELGISLEELKSGKTTPAIQQLISKQLQRADHLLKEGSMLTTQLSGLFGFEIRLIIAGGQQIVCALKSRKTVYARPILKVWHWPILIYRALSL